MESFNDVEIIYPNIDYEERKKKVAKYHSIGLPITIISFFLVIFSLFNSLKYYFQDNKLYYNLFVVLLTISVISFGISLILGSAEIERSVLLAKKIRDIKIHKLNIYKEKSITEFILVNENNQISEERVTFLEFIYKINMDKPLLNLEESKLYIPYED